MLTHPIKLASLCASEYPVRTEYIKGKTDTLKQTDTITGPSIKIPCPEQKEKGQPVFVDCPPNKTITKNIETIRIDTVVKLDSAMATVLRHENSQIKQDKDNWRNWLFYSLIVNVVLLLWCLFKK